MAGQGLYLRFHSYGMYLVPQGGALLMVIFAVAEPAGQPGNYLEQTRKYCHEY